MRAFPHVIALAAAIALASPATDVLAQGKGAGEAPGAGGGGRPGASQSEAALQKCRGDGFTCKAPIGSCVDRAI